MPNGDIRSCVHLSSERLGNVFRDNIDLSEQYKKLRKWHDGSLAFKECKKCDYKYVCNSGCRVDAKAYSGKLNGKDPLMVGPIIDGKIHGRSLRKFVPFKITYDKKTRHLYAKGNALLQRPDLRMAANEISYNLEKKSGEGKFAKYRWPLNLSRGSAERVKIIDEQNSAYMNATYTTCNVHQDDWLLDAEYLEIDRGSGLATARNATLSLFGMPVAWTPWLTYPIDDRRRSGVLSPSYKSSEKHGSEFVVPYYFNLAPNYDLTIL